MKTLYKTNKRISNCKKAIQLTFLSFFIALSNLAEAGVNKTNACNAYTNFTYSVSNKTVTFTNLSTGVNKYEWGFGDGGSSGAQSPVHTYSTSNYFWVVLYAYDTTVSNCYDSTVLRILVPGCNVKAGFGYSISGSAVSFENRSDNVLGTASKYAWNFGDGSTSSAQHPVHTYSGSGPYNVMCVLTDTSFTNCTDTFYHAFSLNDCDVVIDFTYTFTGPKTIKVTNTSVHANHFSLPFDGNGEYIYEFPYPGVFQFALFGWNTYCSYNTTDTTFKTIVVPGCHAHAQFSFGRDTNSTFAGILYDYSTYRSGATYKWHFGDGDSSTSKTPNHTYPGPGKYNLCLTITDSICISTYCDTIEYDSSGNMVGLTVPFSLQVIDAVLGIEKAKLTDDRVSVYPNPGSGIFTISKESNPIREVRVFDLQGKLMASQKCDDNKVSLDLSALSNGVYIFTVQDQKGVTRVLKVMKL